MRVIDIILSLLGAIILFVPAVVISIAIKLTSKGPVIHWSKRIGKNNQFFLMPKFRTMKIDTPQLATHLLDGDKFLTSIGSLLRKSSLDELPQIFSVLVGDMALVGPRPALFNQDELKKLRTEKNIHFLKPGITGWAQINGRDDLLIEEKVKLDFEYAKRRSCRFDLKIILLTFGKVLFRKGVTH